MKPKHLNVELTTDCNQKCPYCSNPKIDDYELSYVEWLRVIEDTKATSVHLTGGEPLLYKDITKLIINLHSLGIDVSILTNGSVPKLLVNNKEVFSKLRTVQISLDSTNPETHDKRRGFPAAYNNAIKTIEFFKSIGIETEISMVVDSETVSGIDDMVTFCEINKLNLILRPLAVLGRSKIDFTNTPKVHTSIVIPDRFGYGAKSVGDHIPLLTLSPKGNEVSYR